MKKNIFEAEIVNKNTGKGQLNSSCAPEMYPGEECRLITGDNYDTGGSSCSDYTDCDGGYWCSSCTSGY